VFKGLSFDAPALFEDLLPSTEVAIRGDPVLRIFTPFFFLPLNLALGMIARPSSIGYALGIALFSRIDGDVIPRLSRRQPFYGDGVTAQTLAPVRGRRPGCVTHQPALASFRCV
jgi:hypothetical protein